MKILRFLLNSAYLVLLFFLCVCGFLLWSSQSDSREQTRIMESIASYKPQQTARMKTESDVMSETEQQTEFETEQEIPSEQPITEIEETIIAEETIATNEETITEEAEVIPKKTVVKEPVINQSIIDLQLKYPDVSGWLTIDNTAIDHPFVQSRDNEDYLRRDLDGNYLLAGTIFADCRCDISSSFLTILYGHNFDDETMFGDLCKFDDDKFWTENTSGTLYLPRETYQMQMIAYLVVTASDSEIYAPYIDTESEIADFQKYIKQNARKYREADLTLNDKILVLSTCNYEFTGARSVLIVKLVSESGNQDAQR